MALGIPIFILSFRYPRQALWAFLIYLPFSGTVVYSAIGQGNALFQLVTKDVFYFPALFGLIYECSRKRKPILIPKKLLFSLGILIFFALLTLFFVNGMKEFLPTCNSLSAGREVSSRCQWRMDYQSQAQGKLFRHLAREVNPFLQGILGLKVLLGYIPLIFCAHYLIEDKKKLFFLGTIISNVGNHLLLH